MNKPGTTGKSFSTQASKPAAKPATKPMAKPHSAPTQGMGQKKK